MPPIQIRCRCGRMTDFGITCAFCYELYSLSNMNDKPEEEIEEKELDFDEEKRQR